MGWGVCAGALGLVLLLLLVVVAAARVVCVLEGKGVGSLMLVKKI